MATLGQRLRAARGKITRERAGELLGIHPNTLKRYEDDQRVPPEGLVDRAASAYASDAGWLRNERGKSPAGWVGDSPLPFRRDDAPPPGRDEIVNVPIFDIRSGAGAGQIAESEEPIGHLPLPRALLVKRGINPKGAAMGFTHGSSMRPTLDDGDPYIFDRTDREPRDEVFLMKRGGELIVKQLQRKSDGTVVLISHNVTFEPEELPRDEADTLEIIGRVGMVLRSL